MDDNPRLPSNDNFPYMLVVNDHCDETVCYYPRNGWACLWRYDEDEPVYDGNPYPEQYIQEQPINSEDDIAGDIFRYQVSEQELSSPWAESPSNLFRFIEVVRDDYYESEVDSREEIPVFVETYVNDDEDYFEIYFLDSRGGEYIMWNSDELYGEVDGELEPNSELIQTVLGCFADAYEEPQEFLEKFGDRRVQAEKS